MATLLIRESRTVDANDELASSKADVANGIAPQS
jgi:hypothetical protein